MSSKSIKSLESSKSAAHISPETTTEQESTMSTVTEKQPSVTHVILAAHDAAQPKTTTEAPTAVVATTTPIPAPVVTPATGIKPPPAEVNIPAPPADYAPATPGEFRTVVPRQSELASLPQASIDLGNFTDYTQVLGATVFSHPEVAQTLELARLWTTNRQATSKWNAYASLQEGLVWRAVRAHMERLRPAFLLAAASNPSLVTKYPGLSSLLGAKKVIAQKGASTKKANNKAEAEGKAQVHGAVGKSRQKAAAKAALAEKEAAAAAAAEAAAQAQAVQVPPAGAPVAPVPANGGASNGSAANGAGGNGAGHS